MIMINHVFWIFRSLFYAFGFSYNITMSKNWKRLLHGAERVYSIVEIPANW